MVGIDPSNSQQLPYSVAARRASPPVQVAQLGVCIRKRTSRVAEGAEHRLVERLLTPIRGSPGPKRVPRTVESLLRVIDGVLAVDVLGRGVRSRLDHCPDHVRIDPIAQKRLMQRAVSVRAASLVDVRSRADQSPRLGTARRPKPRRRTQVRLRRRRHEHHRQQQEQDPPSEVSFRGPIIADDVVPGSPF